LAASITKYDTGTFFDSIRTPSCSRSATSSVGPASSSQSSLKSYAPASPRLVDPRTAPAERREQIQQRRNPHPASLMILWNLVSNMSKVAGR
jgi:hypothetical protein